jgi:predicted XRE-type DNA-binding protein
MRNGAPKRTRARVGSETLVERSSGNVFADLGLPDADVTLAKAELAARIGTILADRRMTQREAAEVLGIDQPGVSDLLRGQLRRYSSDRLFRFLNALGHDVDIVVINRGARARRAGRLRVRGAGVRTAANSSRPRP